jgi:hypothetical protein
VRRHTARRACSAASASRANVCEITAPISAGHRVLKAATIEFRGDSIDCVIRDLSTTGAVLEVSSQTGIPAKFTLVIPGDALHLPCAVVWRSQYRIGVHFD